LRVDGAATSIDALRLTVLAPACFDGSETGQDCWSNIRVPAGRLVVATMGTYCPNREWFAWVSGRTLTLELTTWGCTELPHGLTGGPADARAAPSDTVLGVPLDRFPRGQIEVRFANTDSPPVTVSTG
jgi:hypothetical protein